MIRKYPNNEILPRSIFVEANTIGIVQINKNTRPNMISVNNNNVLL